MFQYHIRGENIAITDAIRDYAETKLSKLEKYFSEDETVTVNVTAKVYPNKRAKDQTLGTVVSIWLSINLRTRF